MSITEQIEKQYAHFDIDELNKDFSGTLIDTPKNSTFSQSREIALENLKNQYNYYLRRYESAYGQLMVNKSPVLLNSQNNDKINTLESTVFKLNNKLKGIVQAISNNNNQNDVELQQILKENEERNYQINENNKKIIKTQSSVGNNYQDLVSETQMMVYGAQRYRNKNHKIWLYSFLCAFVFFLYVGFYIKLTKK